MSRFITDIIGIVVIVKYAIIYFINTLFTSNIACWIVLFLAARDYLKYSWLLLESLRRIRKIADPDNSWWYSADYIRFQALSRTSNSFWVSFLIQESLDVFNASFIDDFLCGAGLPYCSILSQPSYRFCVITATVVVTVASSQTLIKTTFEFAVSIFNQILALPYLRRYFTTALGEKEEFYLPRCLNAVSRSSRS